MGDVSKYNVGDTIIVASGSRATIVKVSFHYSTNIGGVFEESIQGLVPVEVFKVGEIVASRDHDRDYMILKGLDDGGEYLVHDYYLGTSYYVKTYEIVKKPEGTA